MDSKMKFGGQPLHSFLVGFPVTLYLVTLGAFVAHVATGSRFWWSVGLWANLMGVLLALAAAVPGFVDLMIAIPKRHPAKRVGYVHMALNLAALAAFIGNLFAQRATWTDMPRTLRVALHVERLLAPDASTAVFLSSLGVGITIVAAALGWRLVQKHGIGVPDPLELPRRSARMPFRPPSLDPR